MGKNNLTFRRIDTLFDSKEQFAKALTFAKRKNVSEVIQVHKIPD